MNKSVNKVTLLGRLGAEPEVRYTKSSMCIANVSLATNYTVKDKNNEWVEMTEWHRVIFFNGLAKVVKEYLHKGSPIYVEGRLQTKKWKDKDGIDRWSTEIIANDLVMQGGKSSNKEPVPPITEETEEDDPF
jgi:single-strand DNA-binding protein